MGDSLSPGDLMSFMVTAQTIQSSMTHFSVLFGQTVRGWTAGGRIFEVMSVQKRLATVHEVFRSFLKGPLPFVQSLISILLHQKGKGRFKKPQHFMNIFNNYLTFFKELAG